MKSSTFFSGALSKANTAIAQAKNDPKYGGNTPADIMEEKAAYAIYPELVNMDTDLIFSSFVKAGLANSKTDVEIPMDMRTNVLVLICELVIKEALSLSLNSIEPTEKTYETARLVWFSGDFKPTKKVKQHRNSDGVKLYKSAEELEAEMAGEGDCAGGGCKI